MKTTWYLFRHGLATKSSTTGYGKEIVSAQLLPEGISAIENVAQLLTDKPCDIFVSSPYVRCVQTAEIVKETTGHSFSTDNRVGELHNILFDDFVTKVKDFIKEVEQKNVSNIWVCTHVAVIVVLEKLILKQPLSEEDVYTNNPLPGSLVILQDGKAQTITF